MINETASTPDDRPALRLAPVFEPNSEDSLRTELRQLVMSIMRIEREPDLPSPLLIIRDSLLPVHPHSTLTATFEGQLQLDAEEAYRQLDEALRPLNQTPYFRVFEGHHVIHIMQGRSQRRPLKPLLNIILLAITFFCLLWIGTTIAAGEIAERNNALAQAIVQNPLPELWRGLPYALALLLIWGGHELGHFFASRYHKVDASLPYFIPLPPQVSFIGTLGAVILQREPLRNRKMLFDVGAAGPLVGMVFAIPILFIGLASAPTGPVTAGGLVEGNSLFYALAKTLMFGRFLPSGGIDVYMNQLTQAGWVGMFVTGLNLLPLGQLDGGHIAYSVFGSRARLFYLPVLALVAALMFISELNMFLWFPAFVLYLLIGRSHAVPLNTITPLDPRRKALAALALVVFIVTFVPMPFTIINDGGVPIPRDAVMLGGLVLAAVLALRSRR